MEEEKAAGPAKAKPILSAKEKIVLLTVTISLCTAGLNFCSNIRQTTAIQRQDAAIDLQRSEIEELRRTAFLSAAFMLSRSMEIVQPAENQALPPVYDEMHGSCTTAVPSPYTLWVLGKDRYNYFLMYPPPQVDPVAGRWTQTNVRLNTPGNWQLAIYLADGEASAWLRRRGETGDWSGFAELPGEMVRLRTVNVSVPQGEGAGLSSGAVGPTVFPGGYVSEHERRTTERNQTQTMGSQGGVTRYIRGLGRH